MTTLTHIWPTLFRGVPVLKAGLSQGLKNPGGLVVLDGDNVSLLVEVGLTDLPKTGGANLRKIKMNAC